VVDRVPGGEEDADPAQKQDASARANHLSPSWPITERSGRRRCGSREGVSLRPARCYMGHQTVTRWRKSGDSDAAGYALPVEPLSPELALVDPELAERARAQPVEGHSPARREALVRQPEPQPRRSPTRADRAAPVEPRRHSRRKLAAVLAAIAVAAGAGGAAAIWARDDGGRSSSREVDQSVSQAQRGRSSATAKSGGRTATRSRPETSHGSAPRSPLRPPPRPPAFRVAGAPREPLDEITLPARARRLEAWLAARRNPTAANVHHWLYQHAWIVTGARFGWWHGAEAIRTLIRVDRRVEARWGIGYRSEAAARQALAEVEAKTK
jgi:hypothetical protein